MKQSKKPQRIHTEEKDNPFKQLLGKLDICIQKNEIGCLSHAIYKTQIIVDKRFNDITRNSKTARTNHGEIASQYWSKQ
jgi:hypothetical protein